MALDKNKLIKDLKDLDKKIKNKVAQDVEEKKYEYTDTTDDWLNGLADIIDTYVRSAKVVVTIPSGAIVTTGSPSSQTNALGVVATSDDNFIDKAGLR